MLAFLLSLVLSARAETADQVIERARAANQVQSAVESLRMTINSKGGGSRVKEFELKSRRDADTNKSLLRVTAPSGEAGTLLLTLDHTTAADEQMMYMPAFKRVNYISGDAKKGAFMGSDFSYEDLAIRDAAASGWTMAEDGAEAWILEGTGAQGSAYTKIRLHVLKSNLLVNKVELFDGKGLLKVLEVKRTETENGVTIPVETVMTNVQKGSSTTIEVTAHQLNVGQDVLPDETFTKAYLERG